MKHKKIILIGIILLAVFFRLQNIAWDQGFHLHPDERFLTMVGVAMKIPTTFTDYFNPTISTLNPSNIGFPFFVYGVFPVVLNKIFAVIFNNDSYGLFTMQGRILTGIVDLLTLIFVFKTALLFEKKKQLPSQIKYWATFFYAIAVLPIQYAHFFTTDIFLNTFMFISFYYSLCFYWEQKYFPLLLSGLFLGLAVACKINAVYILPLILFFLYYRIFKKKDFISVIGVTVVFFVVFYTVVRLSNPYYFESGNFFDLTPSSLFIQNIATLKSFEGKNVTYPPALQWVNTGPFFTTINLALFGIGIPYFFLLLYGMWNVGRRLKLEITIICIWVLGLYIYQSIQFVKVMRYFIFLYPFFALFAGIGAYYLLDKFKRKKRLIGIILVIFILIWPVVFSTIYLVPHTRVNASRWIYQHVPQNATILGEYWDDGLPLPLADPAVKNYHLEQITIFDEDSPAKWEKLNQQLAKGDYYILSSNRGWGSIPTIPSRFPYTTKFYSNLFSGKTSYKLIKIFYPSYYFCYHRKCPRILSNILDESFTVYDHPSVYIFENEKKSR